MADNFDPRNSNIPNYSVPFIDSNGLINQAWWRFIITLFQRSGNASGDDGGIPGMIHQVQLELDALENQVDFTTDVQLPKQYAPSLQSDGLVSKLFPPDNNSQLMRADVRPNYPVLPQNIPVMSAYLNSAQTISSNTYTKVLLSTIEFDSVSSFSTVNSRYQPNVPGYYRISAAIQFSGTTPTQFAIAVYKNGAIYKTGAVSFSVTSGTVLNMTCIVSMNGSTDYVELYGLEVAASALSFQAGIGSTYMQGEYIRGL